MNNPFVSGMLLYRAELIEKHAMEKVATKKNNTQVPQLGEMFKNTWNWANRSYADKIGMGKSPWKSHITPLKTFGGILGLGILSKMFGNMFGRGRRY